MKKTLLSALAMTVALGAGAAYARGNGDMGPRALPSFEELDRDGNGQVTLEDVQVFIEARRAEMEAERAARMAERAAQAGERGQRLFDRVDANDDGVVDAEEYAAFAEMVSERMEHRGKGGERGWGRH